MNMHLGLNLATFQYIDRLGCYHLNRFGLGIDYFLLNFFSTFASVLGMQVTVGLQVNLIAATDTLRAICCRHNPAST